MNRSESKYFHTAARMNKAFLELLEKKDFEYITVKEICEKAGVNRSTFYLHYETVADLLNESIGYMRDQFNSYFSDESFLKIESISTADIDHLFLITPKYLLPYLQYIKDHRRLFDTVIRKSNVFGSQKSLLALFEHVFEPIMERYKIVSEKKFLMLSFYINGIIGIIKIWLEHNCEEPITFISEVITECITPPPISVTPK